MQPETTGQMSTTCLVELMPMALGHRSLQRDAIKTVSIHVVNTAKLNSRCTMRANESETTSYSNSGDNLIRLLKLVERHSVQRANEGIRHFFAQFFHIRLKFNERRHFCCEFSYHVCVFMRRLNDGSHRSSFSSFFLSHLVSGYTKCTDDRGYRTNCLHPSSQILAQIESGKCDSRSSKCQTCQRKQKGALCNVANVDLHSIPHIFEGS